MSSIDDRIVDMQFNNASFEKNVGTSIKSLENLNKALELKDASKGLNNVMVAVKAVDLSAIADGVQNISGKFNTMGAVGLSVINKLVGALMGFAGTSIDAIMDPLIEGGKRRAENIEQAKFMIKGLGKSWEALYKDMDYAVSGTAFGIDQAAKAASQLSASSVKAGRDMKASLRGISGVAAMTGSSYDDIAQIFTTVAGNGRLMASELNRISARGLNAAQALADFYNRGRTGAKLTEKDIREMVSKGKVSFKDFAKAMDGAFGAQATKANELYSGSLSNVRAALSRIGEKFVTPVFEKQRNIFNQLRFVINGVNKALGPFIDLWSDLQKADGNNMVNMLKEVEKAVGLLSNSPNTAYNKEIEAYKKYQSDRAKLKKKGKTLEMSEDAKAGKQHLADQDKLQKAELAAQKKYDKELAKYKAKGSKGKKPKKPKILVDKASREAAGATQEQTPFVKSIAIVADALRNLNNTANAVFGTIGEAFAEAFPADPAAKSLLLSLAEAFKAFSIWLQPTASQLDTLKKALLGFFTVIKIVVTIVSNAFQAIPGIINVVISVFKLLFAVIKPATDLIAQLATSFLGMFKSTGQGVDSIKMLNDALTWLREKGLGTLITMIDNATKAITDFWSGMGDGTGGNLFAGFDPFSGMLKGLTEFGSTMSDFFENAWNWAKGIKDSITTAMSSFGSGAGGFFSGFGQTLKNIGQGMKTFFGELKSGFAKFFEGFDWTTLLAGLSSGAFIAVLVKVIKFITGLFKTFDTFKNLAKGVLESVSGALDGFTATMKSMQNTLKTQMIRNIAVAVALLAGAFWLLSKVDVKGADTAAQAMTLILAEIFGALYLMGKIQSDKGVVKMNGLAASLIVLSLALLVFSKAAAILASIDPERLGGAMVAMGAGLAMLLGALAILSSGKIDSKKIILGAIGLNILAGALVVMAGAIAILGAMDMEMLLQGGIALGALLALITLFAAIPSDNVLKAGIAVGILAPALMLMVGAIAILGTMDMATLLQGGISLAVMISGLVVAVNMLKGTEGGAAAMIAMAAALALLIIPISVFGSMDTNKLAQGIGSTIIMLIGLVGAANLMQKAVPGAAAMIAMAAAIAILSAAVWVLAQIPGDQLMNAFLAIAGGLAILLAAAAVASLGPVAAGIGILTLAILSIGAAVALAGLGMVMFAMGLGGIGAAAQLAVPGLLALGNAAVQLVPQLLAMVALAVALAALAVAVAALGVAFILLGAGLITMGTGMALLAAFGGVGAIAVLAVWKALEPLMWEIPKILALGGAFVVLGAGLITLGAGLALVAVGIVAISVGLLALIATAIGVSLTIDMLRNSLTTFVPIAAQLQPVIPILAAFATSLITLRGALIGIDTALTSVEDGFNSFATSTSVLTSSLDNIPGTILTLNISTSTQLSLLVAIFKAASSTLESAVNQLGTSVQNGSVSLNQSMIKMSSDVAAFGTRLSATTPKIISTIALVITMLNASLKTNLATLGQTVLSSGEKVGNNVLNGFLKGVKDPNNRIGSAARSMAQKFINAMKDEFQIHSPSKVMEELGKYVKEGFYKGLTGFEDEPVHRVIEAVNNMKDELKKAVDESKDDIKDLNSKISKLNKKKKKSKKDKKELRDAKKELADAKKAKSKSEEALKALDGSLKDQQQQLITVSDQYDAVVSKLKDATSALADAEKEMADAQKSYTDQFSKLPDIADSGDLVGTYVSDLQTQIDATLKFAKDLAYVRSLGLDDKTYKKLLDQGVDAQPFLTALIESGQAGVDQINQLDSELGDVAAALGETAAKEMYQNGVNMAKGLVEGLQQQESALKAQMEALATSIVDTIKKLLGIKSPSRVFAEIGGYSMIGLMNGMQKQIPALEKQSEDVGNTAIEGLRNAINEIGAGVYNDMEMNPVIRPVLDLTDVENSAKQLGNVFGQKTIDVGSVYANASDIAIAARARELLIAQQRDEALSSGSNVTFIQNNNSPKALSPVDLYRQTNNQLSVIKKGLPK